MHIHNLYTFAANFETMKKIIPVIAILLLVLFACDSGNIIGGRYFGTFQNLQNNKREAGDLSFKYHYIGETTSFLMNDLVPMVQVSENQYSGIVGDQLLKDFLKTVPAIDSIQVCDSTASIIQMSAEAEFKGNSVKATLHFTTSNDSAKVNVEFIGYFE